VALDVPREQHTLIYAVVVDDDEGNWKVVAARCFKLHTTEPKGTIALNGNNLFVWVNLLVKKIRAALKKKELCRVYHLPQLLQLQSQSQHPWFLCMGKIRKSEQNTKMVREVKTESASVKTVPGEKVSQNFSTDVHCVGPFTV
jgi:hypothetical protein